MSDTVFGGFIWETKKAAIVLSKRGISFVEAASTFGDPNGYVYDNGSPAPRLAIIGFSHSGRLLTVIHEAEGGRIRLITVWAASSEEEDLYVGR